MVLGAGQVPSQCHIVCNGASRSWLEFPPAHRARNCWTCVESVAKTPCSQRQESATAPGAGQVPNQCRNTNAQHDVQRGGPFNVGVIAK
eukprot:6040804-Alexandrium_andersonii.AAC.1